ncbi:MAG: Cof-type HAD-IIB family hydrolase [Aerococcus sp.]|nr:Cof-type HAD-IIB family hydrolase [Aerococcus sp.]
MIQLIAIDLDGTLLRDDKTLSETNQKAVQWASQQGVEVVICSGRPLSGVLPLVKQLGLDQPNHHSIIFNGGAVVDNVSEEIVTQTTLTPADVEQIAEPLLASDLPVDAVSLTHAFQLSAPHNWQSTYPDKTPYLTFSGWESYPAYALPLYKVVATTTKEHLEECLPLLPQSLYDEYAVVRSQPYQLEIMPKAVNKGQALKDLVASLNIPMRQVMAIGDEENDETMFKQAGFAVVMASGNPLMKAQADYITDTNENDGVSVAIRHFVTPKERK